MAELCCKPRHQREGRFATRAFDMHPSAGVEFIAPGVPEVQEVDHFPVCEECWESYWPGKGFTFRAVAKRIRRDLVPTPAPAPEERGE